MGTTRIFRGIFKEGAIVASAVQKSSGARIMLKGAEPTNPEFLAILRRVADAGKAQIDGFPERELCAVLMDPPAAAERFEIAPDDIRAMGLTRVSLMDGACGIVTKVLKDEPAPTPLAYASLRAGGAAADQPGLADIPEALARKTHRDLSPPQQKIFEAAAQIAGRGLLRMVCFEDEGLRLVATVHDMPPARARSVLVPLGALADELGRGTPLEEIGKRLSSLRT